jgi:hypothetical protein
LCFELCSVRARGAARPGVAFQAVFRTAAGC